MILCIFFSLLAVWHFASQAEPKHIRLVCLARRLIYLQGSFLPANLVLFIRLSCSSSSLSSSTSNSSASLAHSCVHLASSVGWSKGSNLGVKRRQASKRTNKQTNRPTDELTRTTAFGNNCKKLKHQTTSRSDGATNALIWPGI